MQHQETGNSLFFMDLFRFLGKFNYPEIAKAIMDKAHSKPQDKWTSHLAPVSGNEFIGVSTKVALINVRRIFENCAYQRRPNATSLKPGSQPFRGIGGGA